MDNDFQTYEFIHDSIYLFDNSIDYQSREMGNRSSSVDEEQETSSCSF